MISNELQEAIKPRSRLLTTIWGAFMAATFIYVFVCWLVVRGPAVEGSDWAAGSLDSDLLTAVLAGLAVLLAAASYVYPRYAFTPGRLAQVSRPPTGIPNPKDPTAAEAQSAARLAESERALLKYLPAYQTASIVVWAMRESIAVLGVVLTIVTRQFASVLPFAVAALVLLWMARPNLVGFLEGAKGRG